jgi:NAD-dependent SIR2 family protein deacetylase
VSTGLFGYPNKAAAEVAVTSVVRWLLEKPSRLTLFETLVFDVFTAADEEAYAAVAPTILAQCGAQNRAAGQEDEKTASRAPSSEPARLPAFSDELAAVASEIASTDRLLIVAAAGLSISDTAPNNPYHSNADFTRHYPTVCRFGYSNAFEAMGLAADTSVPASVRVAFMAQHFLNMRFRFPPTPAYDSLRRLASTYQADNVFVWTSNVDGCFERAGFGPANIYQTQGEMRRLQCARDGCGHVWDCVDQLSAIQAATVDGALSDMSLVPTCPRCGSRWPDVRPNLRGGDWFIHAPYEEAGRRLLAWLDECVDQRAQVAIVEVGVGPNTPIVTRIPACAFASAVRANGGRPVYLRVNPDAPERADENPDDSVTFCRVRQTWRALEPLVDAVVPLRSQRAQRATANEPSCSTAGINADPQAAALWRRRYHQVLLSLRTPRQR